MKPAAGVDPSPAFSLGLHNWGGAPAAPRYPALALQLGPVLAFLFY
jgi:hypothetical protein